MSLRGITLAKGVNKNRNTLEKKRELKALCKKVKKV